MARLVILGAGIAGHTAAIRARQKLGPQHEVVVISPKSRFNWIPSNIWVGVGYMRPEQVSFELKPVYDRRGIIFYQAKAISIHPEGSRDIARPFVTIEYTGSEKKAALERITYDYLLNATGPKLNFDATNGLGPNKNSLSVCTSEHAATTASIFKESIARLKQGEQQTFIVGLGHGNATCQGAAFEYVLNIEYELRRRKVRDKAKVIYITNEYELGDFGIGGLFVKRAGYITHSRIFTESLFTERNIEWITQAHVSEVTNKEVVYENLNGEEKSINFNFAMLLPPFRGVDMKAYNKNDEDISHELFAPNGFMVVDGDYSKKPYEQWKPSDWPETYQNPVYKNIFAVGIAFAPPHSISKPMINRNGIPIFPTPPRTGMPSGVMARIVAYNIVDMMEGKVESPVRKASLAKMGISCIASAGASLLKGTAISMTAYPVVPDFERYPDTGRDLNYTIGEIGLAGHWIKYLLHFGFMYKAKTLPFWQMIPE
ncbi:MAG: NAD(P)/FAD-dependent oxidoreductase [Candidatus Kryptoniota bacterium]